MNSSTDGRAGVPRPQAGGFGTHAGRWAAAALLYEDFDEYPSQSDEPAAEVQAPSPITDADVAAARDASYREGHAAALREVVAQRAEAVSQAMAAIAATMQDASQVALALVEKRSDEVANLLLGVLGKLFPDLWARHGGQEAAAVVRTIVPAIAHLPSLRIRANPDTLPELQQELAQLEADVYGRMEFVPTPRMPAGDVRVEWQEGAAVRDGNNLWQAIMKILGDCGLLTEAPGSEGR